MLSIEKERRREAEDEAEQLRVALGQGRPLR
jgi:hypothetical protein